MCYIKLVVSAKLRVVALTASVYWLLSKEKWMELSLVDLERRIVYYGCYSPVIMKVRGKT